MTISVRYKYQNLVIRPYVSRLYLQLLVKSITTAVSCHKDEEQTTQTESIYYNADSEGKRP